MLHCYWLPIPAHRVRHVAHRVGRAVHRFRRHHHTAWVWVCVSTGAPIVLGGGAAAGWGLGRAGAWFQGSPVLGGGWGSSAWAATPAAATAPVAVPEPGTAALLGAFVLLMLALKR